MENIGKLVAENIKAARKRKKWTQNDLAEASGVSFRGIQDIEAAKRSPRPNTINAIAGALGVQVDELYSASEANNQSDSSILARAITLLATLDDGELRDVIDFIEDSRSLSSGSARSTKVR